MLRVHISGNATTNQFCAVVITPVVRTSCAKVLVRGKCKNVLLKIRQSGKSVITVEEHLHLLVLFGMRFFLLKNNHISISAKIGILAEKLEEHQFFTTDVISKVHDCKLINTMTTCHSKQQLFSESEHIYCIVDTGCHTKLISVINENC